MAQADRGGGLYLFRTIRIFFLLLFLLLSSTAFSHPGKTDFRDGHTCLKNCDEWDLDYDEYHLHDKDRNAVRLGDRKKPAGQPVQMNEPAPVQAVNPPAATPVPAAEQSMKERPVTQVVRQEYSMPVQEAWVFSWSDVLLTVIAGLLFLILVSLRRKKVRE
jgi:hypothetical protein